MTANSEHAEQRRKHRVSLPDHPQVYDAHSGELIGELVNLSADGLMLASDKVVDCGSVCQLRIPLMQGDEQVEIRIGSESLWSEDAHGSGVYWTGLQIIDISPEDQAIIDAVVGD